MEIKELEGMSSSELLELSDKIRQKAMEKMILEQLEAKLPEIERQIEKAHASYCLSQLAQEQARIQELLSREADLKSRQDSLQRQLNTSREKQSQLEAENASQDKELQALLAEKKEHQQQRQGYLTACRKKVSEFLPFIRTETYEAYVTSLYSRDNVVLIYNSMMSAWNRGDTEKLELYQDLIKEYIEISRRITGKDTLQLQKAEIGMLFSSSLFDKTARSPETGRISNIIYYGLERNGMVFENCRSLVEVE